MLMKRFNSMEIGRTIFLEDLSLFNRLTQSERTVSAVPSELLLYIVHGILNRSLNLEKELLAVLEQSINIYKLPNIGDTIYVQFDIECVKPTVSCVTYCVKCEKDEQLAAGFWKLKLKKEEV